MITIEPEPNPSQAEDPFARGLAASLDHSASRNPPPPSIPRPAPLPSGLSTNVGEPTAYRFDASPGHAEDEDPLDGNIASGTDYQPPRRPPQSLGAPPAASTVSVATETDPRATTKPKVRRASAAPPLAPSLLGPDRMLAWGIVLGGLFVALIVVIVQLLIPSEPRKAVQAATAQPEKAQRADHSAEGPTDSTAGEETFPEQSSELAKPPVPPVQQSPRETSPRRNSPRKASAMGSSSPNQAAEGSHVAPPTKTDAKRVQPPTEQQQ